jgi:hypothetical protein
MFDFYRQVLNAVRKYTTLDYGFFKFLMISFGILLGAYFPQFFLNIMWLVWIIFILSAIWMIAKIYKYLPK